MAASIIKGCEDFGFMIQYVAHFISFKILMLFINLLTSISIQTLLSFAHVYMSFNEVNFNLPMGGKKQATFQHGCFDYQRV